MRRAFLIVVLVLAVGFSAVLWVPRLVREPDDRGGKARVKVEDLSPAKRELISNVVHRILEDPEGEVFLFGHVEDVGVLMEEAEASAAVVSDLLSRTPLEPWDDQLRARKLIAILGRINTDHSRERLVELFTRAEDVDAVEVSNTVIYALTFHRVTPQREVCVTLTSMVELCRNPQTLELLIRTMLSFGCSVDEDTRGVETMASGKRLCEMSQLRGKRKENACLALLEGLLGECAALSASDWERTEELGVVIQTTHRSLNRLELSERGRDRLQELSKRAEELSAGVRSDGWKQGRVNRVITKLQNSLEFQSRR